MDFHYQELSAQKMEEIIKQVSQKYLTREASLHIEEKGVSNFVTEADKAIEKGIKEELSTLYPWIQFLGEESEDQNVDFSGAVWILDPIDGTANFIHDLRHSCLSLALAINKEVAFGIIYHYYTGECFYAQKGMGAYLNGSPIHVSSVKELKYSLASFGTSPYYKEEAEGICDNLKKVYLLCEDIRRFGSAALELSYVACGRIDLYLEKGLKPWDYAAAIILIQEAGGTITDYQGHPIDVSKPCDILAGNGVVEKKLLEAITL